MNLHTHLALRSGNIRDGFECTVSSMGSSPVFSNDLAGVEDCYASDGTVVDAAPICVEGDAMLSQMTCAHFTFSGAGSAEKGGWAGRKVTCAFDDTTVVGDKTCCIASAPCSGRAADELEEDIRNVEVRLPAGATSPTVWYIDWEVNGYSYITGDIQ